MSKGIRVYGAAIVSLALLFSIVPSFCLAESLTVWAFRDGSYQLEQQGHWAVILTFNREIFRSNLTDAVKATRNGVQIPVKVVPRDGGTKTSRRYRIISTEPEKEPASIKVTLNKGLSDATGRLLLEKDFTYEFLSMERVSVTGWTTFYKSVSNKGISINLSRSVPDRELAQAVSITPEVPGMRVSQQSGRSYRITGDFLFEEHYVLHVSEARVREGKYLLEAKEIAFKGPGLKSAIAPRTKRTVVELRGRQLFPLTLTNVSKVRCQLINIPPYLAPEFLSGDQTGEAQRDKEVGKPGNAEQTEALKALGRISSVSPHFLGQFTEHAEAFFAPDAKDHVLGYSLPLSFRKDPANGGIWMALFSDPDGNFKEETGRAIQITDLSLSYKISAKTLLLWVTSIHTGEPVKGAQAFVSDEDGFRYFVGKTDRNGVLFLEDGRSFPAVGRKKESAKRCRPAAPHIQADMCCCGHRH